MITKERLEELIEQGAIIYWISSNNVTGINLSLLNIKLDNDDCIVKNKMYGNFLYKISYKELTEDKDEAEWFGEFGCIERTERLELPTWEEFDKKGYIEFVGKEATKLILEKTLTIDCDREPISYYVLEILIDDYNHSLLFEAEYTKENYTLACRKAKELFLGEKK